MCLYADFFIIMCTPCEVVRGRCCGRAMDAFNRLKTYIAIQGIQSGMFLFRTHEEQMNLYRLKAIPAATIKGFLNHEMVADAACCVLHPLLVANFRFLHKKKPYWKDLVQQERLIRYMYGLGEQYKSMPTIDVPGYFRIAALPNLKSSWKSIELSVVIQNLRRCSHTAQKNLGFRT